jgi:ABC-type Zn uptake system ZnuABC Zn-binding protein ZnuA
MISAMKTGLRIGILQCFALLAFAFGCPSGEQGGGATGRGAKDAPLYVASIQPVAMILRELAEDRCDVVCLLQPTAYPYDAEPQKEFSKTVKAATAFFYVDDSMEVWAPRLPAKNKVKLADFVPRELRLKIPDKLVSIGRTPSAKAGALDPYCWTSPKTVKSLLPALADELVKLDPEGEDLYRSNAASFAKRLDALEDECSKKLAPHRGRAAVVLHPAFYYLFRDYGLEVAGSLDGVPGSEPHANAIKELAVRAGDAGARAIFSEPQFPQTSARYLADQSGLAVFMLDAYGAIEGLDTYEKLIRYDVDTIAAGFAAKKPRIQGKGSRPGAA